MTNLKEELKLDDFHTLLDHASRNVYRAGKDADPRSEAILNRCLKLLGKDYKYAILNNTNGELCSHYPTKIPILEYIVSGNENNIGNGVQSLYDMAELKELFNKARFARCRARFAVPVILCEGKHICRGATISGGAELYGRTSLDFFFAGGESIPEGAGQSEAASSEWHLFTRYRSQDIRLLKTLCVGHICDLMVEKKKVKFGMNVTSSEKVDKENRYSDFGIWSMPYPGCEFFREWRDKHYVAEGMMFDWNQAYCDALLDLTGRLLPPHNIDWTTYRKWDLVKLTQNYVRLFLHYIKEGDSGLLIHCISGWDRTPLFISLVRLSLWADGLAHPGLTPMEILYFTMAYDWFLFGHNFPDRLCKGEEIFFFCFNFLKYIASEEFSLTSSSQPRSPHGSSGRMTSRTDSECNIDGVLLEPDIQRASYRGSNTSISSISSAASTKSSVDNAPIYFTTGSPEEDAFVANGNPSQYTSTQQQHPAASRTVVDPSHHRMMDPSHRASGSSSTGVSSCTVTKPVTVPSHVHKIPERQSPSCGSWQIISGSGSFRGSTSSHDSARSSASEQSPKPHTGCECPESEESAIPIRRQKLETVRNIFLSVYNTAIGFPHVPEPSAGIGGISGLLGNFAEKVGFKQSRGSVV